jgi:1-acyl-sn-glycerol-3-phosphate acyltransferase
VRALPRAVEVAFGLWALAVAGVAALVMGVFGVLPFAWLPAGRRERYTVPVAQAWAWVVLRLGLFCRVRVEGLMPPPGPLLVWSNHESLVEPLVLLAVLGANGLAKREVRSFPILGFFAGLTGALFVDRADESARQVARRRVRERVLGGGRLAVFPQGRRSPPPLPATPPSAGTAADAFAAGYSLLPCYVEGGSACLPPDRAAACPGQTVWLQLGRPLSASAAADAASFVALAWGEVRALEGRRATKDR